MTSTERKGRDEEGISSSSTSSLLLPPPLTDGCGDAIVPVPLDSKRVLLDTVRKVLDVDLGLARLQKTSERNKGKRCEQVRWERARGELDFSLSLSPSLVVAHLQRDLESTDSLNCLRSCIESDLVGVGVVRVDLDFVRGRGGHGGWEGGRSNRGRRGRRGDFR